MRINFKSVYSLIKKLNKPIVNENYVKIIF